MVKRQYHLEMDTILKALPQDTPPKLLLHSCCGPCSTAVLESLTPHFEILLYYYNPCIAPKAEFERRLETQKQLLDQMQSVNPITLIAPPYNNDEYMNAVGEAYYTPEGGERCRRCIAQRMEEAARATLKHECLWFTTTLSVSPHKNAPYINECGAALAERYDLHYLPADFKKRGGYARSIALSHTYSLYRQDYCGCLQSLAEAQARRSAHSGVNERNTVK